MRKETAQTPELILTGRLAYLKQKWNFTEEQLADIKTQIVGQTMTYFSFMELEEKKKADNVNVIQERNHYKDGGTTSYLVIFGPLKGKTVFKDGRIQTKTFGKFFDIYPGDNGAKMFTEHTFTVRNEGIYK